MKFPFLLTNDPMETLRSVQREMLKFQTDMLERRFDSSDGRPPENRQMKGAEELRTKESLFKQPDPDTAREPDDDDPVMYTFDIKWRCLFAPGELVLDPGPGPDLFLLSNLELRLGQVYNTTPALYELTNNYQDIQLKIADPVPALVNEVQVTYSFERSNTANVPLGTFATGTFVLPIDGSYSNTVRFTVGVDEWFDPFVGTHTSTVLFI